MPSIGLISNPNSGTNKKQLAAINRIVADYPKIHHFITRSASDISSALSVLQKKGVKTLAINGGDGTTAAIFTRLFTDTPFPVMPEIALLPGGTTNMNVGDVGLHSNLLKAIDSLCNISTEKSLPEKVERPILQVTYDSPTKTIYGMFFGAGAIIQGIEYCHKNGHSPGIAMARTIWGLMRNDSRFAQPVDIKIRFDPENIAREYETLLFFSSTLEKLLLGLQPYWGKQPGQLHNTLITAKPKKFIRALPALLRGKPSASILQSSSYFSNNSQHIDLEMDSLFTLDGEIYLADSKTGRISITATAPLTFLRSGK
ncbi:MAG: diacylglycerol kinase family protein [Gammaproteobacteria bacterium]